MQFTTSLIPTNNVQQPRVMSTMKGSSYGSEPNAMRANEDINNRSGVQYDWNQADPVEKNNSYVPLVAKKSKKTNGSSHNVLDGLPSGQRQSSMNNRRRD